MADSVHTPTNVATADQVMSAQEPEPTIESCIQLAKRAIALRKFEDAVDHYATALEISTKEHGENSPENADLLFAYGKALLENAITQNVVLGKEEAEGTLEYGEKEQGGPSGSDSKTDGRFHFEGDEEEEEKTVDLLGAQPEDAEEEEEEEDGEAEEDGEPEDDFNAAWEVLELARSLYEGMSGDAAKLKLADTYVALGDVSLETEKFDEAIKDYTAALTLKTSLLPIHSRQMAEAHYKLSMVLDLTSGRLSDAIIQAEKARESVIARLNVLRGVIQNGEHVQVKDNGKGKGKASEGTLDDDLKGLGKEEVISQIKEFEDLENDLALKIEDLKATPAQAPNSTLSAPEQALKELDKALNAPSLQSSSAAVNDLTGMVKKKKEKRKAEGEVDMNDGKKLKME